RSNQIGSISLPRPGGGSSLRAYFYLSLSCVIAAKAGSRGRKFRRLPRIPAFAGMTEEGVLSFVASRQSAAAAQAERHAGIRPDPRLYADLSVAHCADPSGRAAAP